MSHLDLELLLRLRAVVARVGELDLAGWWNTKGQLGKHGALALKRGFPRTYRFAAARSVFAVAAHRCHDVFSPTGACNLFSLAPEIEEAFDQQWEIWLDSAAGWEPFFEQVQSIATKDIIEALSTLSLISEGDVRSVQGLRRTGGRPAVQLPNTFSGSSDDLRLLAAAFAKSDAGALCVPYALIGG